ncbi:MAG: precorrin-6A reductase [Eubacteriales bacterium]
MNKRVIVFAGTQEGREICEYLCQNHIETTACVATKYGSFCIENITGLNVLEGRLEAQEIRDLIAQYDYVVDASHPYAQVVSENINTAYETLKDKRPKKIRIVRESAKEQGIRFDNIITLCEYLSNKTGNILLTTGSKDLHHFQQIKAYESRVYPRILPAMESLEKAIHLGFQPSNIICMQGPFSIEMNVAMMRSAQIKYVVSKDTGGNGGFPEKFQAAKITGATLLTVGRPTVEQGLTIEEVKQFFLQELHIQTNNEKCKVFPLFLDMKGKQVLVVGAGKVGMRRIEKLASFACSLKVVAQERDALEADHVQYIQSEFKEEHLEHCDIVIAATNDRMVNDAIYQACKKRGILVNVCDNPKQCDFYFPALFDNHDLIGGIVSKDGDKHNVVKNTVEAIRDIL